MYRITNSTAWLRYWPPADASPSKVVMYVLKYRKVGSNSWKRTNESTREEEYVTGLEANTRYEFRLVARYQGESSTMESTSVMATTSGSKCALLIFPYAVSQFKLPLGLVNNW